jgi:hypothetical protein
MKNATAIGDKYPKLISAVERCHWCETVWTKLYRGDPIEDIDDTCDKCGRCVACCADEGVCEEA